MVMKRCSLTFVTVIRVNTKIEKIWMKMHTQTHKNHIRIKMCLSKPQHLNLPHCQNVEKKRKGNDNNRGRIKCRTAPIMSDCSDYIGATL